MALEISGNVELVDGITLPSCYGRTDYRVNNNSSEIVIITNYWKDLESYTDGRQPLRVGFSTGGRYTYDRTTDGIDVLDFTNEKIKTELEALGFSVVITEL